jgi:undecaprenyl-diphosphatase
MFETLRNWDRDIFVWLNAIGIEPYDSFWIFVTQIESWVPLFSLFFFLIVFFYGWKKGALVLVFLLATTAATLLFTGFVKESIQRLRPNNVKALSSIIRILQKPENYSFFSGHASSSFVIVSFIVLALRGKTKWIYLTFIWPLLFVMSRIYVGVHYPSDLLVGALVGTLFAILGYYFCLKVLQRFNSRNSQSISNR